MQRLRSASLSLASAVGVVPSHGSGSAAAALAAVSDRSTQTAKMQGANLHPQLMLSLPVDLLTAIFETYLEMCRHDRRLRITPLLRLCKTTLPILLTLIYTQPTIHTRIQFYKFVCLPSITTKSYVRSLVIEPNGKWDMVDQRDKPWEAIALSQSSRYGRSSAAYEWRAEMGFGKSSKDKKDAQWCLAAYRRGIRGDQFRNLRVLTLRDCHTMEPAVFQIARYEELHLEGQCWALVADTIPSSTSPVLLTATSDTSRTTSSASLPGSFPFLKSVSWKGLVADLPYYMLFRVIEESRTCRRAVSVRLHSEEGKALTVDLTYKELWQRPDMPTGSRSGSMQSPSATMAGDGGGYFDATRRRSSSVTAGVRRLSLDATADPGLLSRSGESEHASAFPIPIGSGTISASSHKLQKIKEQHENHMAIIERIADCEGVDIVRVAFEGYPHVFCEEFEEDEDELISGIGGWKMRRSSKQEGGMRSERHKKVLLRQCERGDGCRPDAKTPSESYSESLLRYKPSTRELPSPTMPRFEIDPMLEE